MVTPIWTPLIFELGKDVKKLPAKADFPAAIIPNEASEDWRKNDLRDVFGDMASWFVCWIMISLKIINFRYKWNVSYLNNRTIIHVFIQALLLIIHAVVLPRLSISIIWLLRGSLCLI